jgi:hypothetical protein
MVTADQAREIALSLPGAEPGAHFETSDFRVRNKIFCTLPEDDRMTVRIAPEEQAALMAENPATFSRPENRWGQQGWTFIRLSGIEADELRELVTDAWRRLAPKKLIAELDTD